MLDGHRGYHDRIALSAEGQRAVQKIADRLRDSEHQHGAQQAQLHHHDAAENGAAHGAHREDGLHDERDLGFREARIHHEGREQLHGEGVTHLEQQDHAKQGERARSTQQFA